MNEIEAIVAGLNPQQRRAVTTDAASVLVVAGAGSGKTRVLTRRIAYLLASGQAHASSILAITFTNKAAGEMRERVGALVGDAAQQMLVATFHSACVRILRREYQHANLRSTFTIYDAADQERLIKMILKERDIDDKRYGARMVLGRISDLKNQLIDPGEATDRARNPIEETIAAIYREYDQRLRAANALDFDDLIMKTVQMLETKPLVAQSYRARFRHILVDEYQDTNHAQYRLIRALVGVDSAEAANLLVVGDSDQSIYAFRGATIRNIEEFESDFPDAEVILLEQNYRSTQNILTAANAVIARNQARRPKNLWTDAGDGPPLRYDICETDRNEAQRVVANLDRLLGSDYSYGDIAVFYRTNAQSRILEEVFMRGGIPYRVIGGTKFYERKEIKDALAYLRASLNPRDEISFARILNTPRRGLGDKTVAALRAHAQAHTLALPLAAAHVWYHTDKDAAAFNREFGSEEITGIEKDADVPPVAGLSARAAKSISELWQLLINARVSNQNGVRIEEILDRILLDSSYLALLSASSDPQDEGRVENLAELHSVAAEYSDANPTDGLAGFLEQVSLVADADQVDTASGQVTLMTVHTAKGLEFPIVFVTGMEEGTFPHQRSLGSEAELAEERRLAYVAITRARQHLFLSRALTRQQWGMPLAQAESRFIKEIPQELLQVHSPEASSRSWSGADRYEEAPGKRLESGWVSALKTTPRTSAPISRATPPTPSGPRLASVSVGARVHHSAHGMGRVVETGGSGNNAWASVDFGDGNIKRLILRYAPLELI